MEARYPIIPNNITIHLGKPSSAAKDITVSFIDYISNVASSELYPTWPKEALIANIYAIITFSLNRIYNEWYRSKGYNFDITSNPSYDQTFIENRSTYENIDNIVSDIFNNYVVKDGQVQPLFTTYCDGKVKTCDGLSQWGSVALANKGMKHLDILKKYYGNDIKIVYDAKVGDFKEGYPNKIITIGDAGNPVLAIIRDLNRIRINYPAIPAINSNIGIYDNSVSDAVKKFQEIFSLNVTGNVDKATWYKIKYVYNSVKKLGDLYSEGLTKDDVTFLYYDELKYGDTGIQVEYMHYFLDAIAFLDKDIPRLPTNSIYTHNTEDMVKAFQNKYKLDVTGVFTYNDWAVLRNVYNNILKSYPSEYQNYVDELYPDYFLTYGMSGSDVRRLQMFLYKICKNKKSIPGVKVNGNFDDLTLKSIYKLQKDYGFEENGVVGPLLWRKLVELSKE